MTTFTAGENLKQGEPVFLGTDGKVYPFRQIKIRTEAYPKNYHCSPYLQLDGWIDQEWESAKATANPIRRDIVPQVIYDAWKIVNESAIKSRGYGLLGVKHNGEWWSVPDDFFDDDTDTPIILTEAAQ